MLIETVLEEIGREILQKKNILNFEKFNTNGMFWKFQDRDKLDVSNNSGKFLSRCHLKESTTHRDTDARRITKSFTKIWF